MRKSLILVLAFIAIAFQACKKSDSGDPQPQPPKTGLSGHIIYLNSGITGNYYSSGVCFLLNGKIYLGLGSYRVNHQDVYNTTQFKVFDLATNTWSDGPTAPPSFSQRWQASAIVSGGKAYIGLGKKPNSVTSLQDWWEFDGTSWNQKDDFIGDINYDTSNPPTYVYNDQMYIGGFVFDPGKTQGTQWSGSSLYSSFTGGAAFVIGDNLYYGGNNNSEKFYTKSLAAPNSVATPVADFIEKANLNHRGFSVDGKGYIFNDDKMVEYNPSENKWTVLNPNEDITSSGEEYMISGSVNNVTRYFIVSLKGEVLEFKP